MVIETTYDSTKILGGGKLHSVFGGGYVLIQQSPSQYSVTSKKNHIISHTKLSPKKSNIKKDGKQPNNNLEHSLTDPNNETITYEYVNQNQEKGRSAIKTNLDQEHFQ